MDRILVILSFVCFIAATFNAPLKVNLVALGLAFWVASLIF